MLEIKKTVDVAAKKPIEAPKKIETSAPLKAAEAPKTAPAKKAEPTTPAAKKTVPAKKATPAKKAEGKKPATKKVAPAKKTAAPKNVKVDVIVEHHDRQIGTDTIVKTAEKLWALAGHDVAKISKVELYVKQEDGAVYCVVNGEAVGKYDL